MHPKRYLADGTTRSVWEEAVADRERYAGGVPRRASRVDVVVGGPHNGLFCVDFTPLAEATGAPRYAVCLVQTFRSYRAAVAVEVRWLNDNWVMREGHDEGSSHGTRETSDAQAAG